MSIQENKELVRRYAEVIYNQKKLENFTDFVDGDLLEEGIEHLQQFFTAFPDSHTTIEDLIAEGDKVVGRLLVSGTNKGPFAGQPPTGKKIQFGSFRIFRIAGGKLVETWAMQDRLGLMEQLGLVQSAGDQVNWAAGEDD